MSGLDCGEIFSKTHKVRSMHWSPYDRVRVVNAVP
jgi:hypothetical protein